MHFSLILSIVFSVSWWLRTIEYACVCVPWYRLGYTLPYHPCHSLDNKLFMRDRRNLIAPILALEEIDLLSKILLDFIWSCVLAFTCTGLEFLACAHSSVPSKWKTSFFFPVNGALLLVMLDFAMDMPLLSTSPQDMCDGHIHTSSEWFFVTSLFHNSVCHLRK